MVLLTNSEISIFRREYGTIKEKTGVKCMLKRDGDKQLKMTFLTLEELMPGKHFLRDLERCVDFSFIYDIVEPLYARAGRPSIDPVLLVKMLLLGYLYGVPSERKLEQEVRVNIAFHWFL